MIIKSIEIEKFRSFQSVSFYLGKRITAIAGRNATQKTTVLGMIGQPFTISKGHPMYGCKTIDGYNFRSQFSEKFKISKKYDVIGEHRWKLVFHRGIYTNIYTKDNDKDYFVVESIARRQAGKSESLRFWNADSRASGAGYVQLPVYYLSLSRLFPIGESGKTKSVSPELTPSELVYCVRNYQSILSIQGNQETAMVEMEKGSSTRVFTGVTDNIHDVFTNSAGESNIMKILLAVLSFRRLKEQYPNDYKGGILLIDEVDATLYGYSQEKLVDYLYRAAGEYRIQIIFTTHSPIILQAVNKKLHEDIRHLGINCPPHAYNSGIIYLEPEYDEGGNRKIVPRNIVRSNELTVALNDINLRVTTNDSSKINIYCEDQRAIAFLRYLLETEIGVNTDLYMNFVDINLGWTNYLQLYEKKVPEFRNNMIILDGDIPQMSEFRRKQELINSAQNIKFLPIVIEKASFLLLKDHAIFNRFSEKYSPTPSFNYDICFRDWTQPATAYDSKALKQWFNATTQAIGNQEILFRLWRDENNTTSRRFVMDFISAFNMLADRNDADSLPKIEP